MKRLMLAGVGALCLGLAGGASAADLAVKAPAVYAPLFTWTGCYLGINGGWIGGDDSWRTRPDGAFLSNLITSAQREELYRLRYHEGADASAGTVGGQFGCQWQWGSFVLGGEWDFNWSGLVEDQYLGGPLSDNFAPVSGSYLAWHHKQLDWFTTARTRLGWAWDRVLIYATGGMAMAAYDAWSRGDFIPGILPAGPEFWGGYREKRIGWTVGGGLEWAFANNWTAKAEFLWLDFGSFDYLSPQLAGVGADPNFYFRTEVEAREYVVRVGLNYLFHLGGAPVVAKF